MNALRFLRDTRAGATAIATAAVTVMTVGGAALIGDHAWLIDQRDVLKAATDAATVATTIEMTRQLGRQPRMTDDALKAALDPVARRYVELNLEHLPEDRLATAKQTLTVEVTPDRNLGTVDISAEADLGGTLFSRHMALLGNYAGPTTIRADAEVECTTNVVEVVLALDITASMNGIIEDNPGDANDKNRLAVAIEAADALVDVLHSGCKQADLAIGVVPWDKSVRLDTPGTWQSNGWVDLSRYTDDANVTESDWAGCVEDRTHDIADIGRSDGLSLALPGTVAFPAFLHPDTTRQDPAIITRMRELIFGQFPDIANTFTAEEVETRLVAYGDNNWANPPNGEGSGGPNFQCTRSTLLPLTSDTAMVKAKLHSLDDASLWGGSTTAHVGVTWGRRMLASSWRTVWGGETHPVDPAEHPPGEVTKALVLLTDGLNGGIDPINSLPGELGVRYQEGTLEPGCNPRKVAGCVMLGDGWVTRYSSLGRLSRLSGRAADGIYYTPDFAFWGPQTGSGTDRFPRKGFNTLMQKSCELARAEGISVYTVSLLPSNGGRNQVWKNRMIDCSGDAEARTRAEREAFHFDGWDQESLTAAFRAIGQRLLTVQRVS